MDVGVWEKGDAIFLQAAEQKTKSARFVSFFQAHFYSVMLSFATNQFGLKEEGNFHVYVYSRETNVILKWNFPQTIDSMKCIGSTVGPIGYNDND